MGDSFTPKHILDGSNFAIWEPRMKAEFQARKFWMINSGNQVAPSREKELENYNTKNDLATSMIFRAKEAWDKLKSIYLGTKASRRFTILQKLLQSYQEKKESVVIYLNKVINLRTQLVGCGCNWINDEFLTFIILQSLSYKFNHLTPFIKTNIDDEKEVLSLENMSRLLLKHEETFNNKILITNLKEPSMALGLMKPHFKNKGYNLKKDSHASKKKFKNGRNKKNYDQDKSEKIKSKFDGNCNFYDIMVIWKLITTRKRNNKMEVVISMASMAIRKLNSIRKRKIKVKKDLKNKTNLITRRRTKQFLMFMHFTLCFTL